MGTIGVHEFVALDGVFETPHWTMEYGFDPAMGEAISAMMGSCEGILLGRVTFEEFAPAWSGRTADEDPGAPFMNDTQKYVVSSTLQTADNWANSTVIGAYDADRIRDLKAELDGNIYVSGSGTLVRALLADGLVDDLHLFVYPLALGEGRRLFAENGVATKLALTESEAYENGVVHLAYGPA